MIEISGDGLSKVKPHFSHNIFARVDEGNKTQNSLLFCKSVKKQTGQKNWSKGKTNQKTKPREKEKRKEQRK